MRILKLLLFGLIFGVTLAKAPPGNKKGIQEQYYAKTFGEVKFNKYRGQLPAKGSMVECAMQCYSLATCHCIRVNINTSECEFFGHTEGPEFDHKSAVAKASEFLYFTRDSSPDTKRNLLGSNKKILTSYAFEQKESNELKKKASKEKNPLKTKSATFSNPWVQVEFKEPIYVTELLFYPLLSSTELVKNLQIRVGNESIAKYYSGGGNWKIEFEQNQLCNYHNGTALFPVSGGRGRKKIATRRSIRCRPCGVFGKFISIQSSHKCTGCNGKTEPESKAGKGSILYPIAFESMEIFGYPVSKP